MISRVLIIFSILSQVLISCTLAQKTPADFGATAFYCFQKNKMDSLFTMIPSMKEITGFAKDLGIVEGSEAYTAFVKRYPLVINSFKQKCLQIQADTLAYKFSWSNAQLEKIEPVQKTIQPDNVPNKKEVLLTVLNIYFRSKGQSFLLKFGDLHEYEGKWKPGNNVSLTIQY